MTERARGHAATVEPVHTVVVRVWLPDRPGALGLIASRIGAVRGDVLGIEILEQGGGRVIDELTVGLPDHDLVDLLITEIHAIDEVSVEDVRPIDGDRVDRGLLALRIAAEVAETDPADRLAALCDGLAEIADASWAVVTDPSAVIESWGEVPDERWLLAFLEGSGHLTGDSAAPSDLLWASLPSAGLSVAAGRDSRPVHARERARVAELARIVDALLVEM